MSKRLQRRYCSYGSVYPGPYRNRTATLPTLPHGTGAVRSPSQILTGHSTKVLPVVMALDVSGSELFSFSKSSTNTATITTESKLEETKTALNKKADSAVGFIADDKRGVWGQLLAPQFSV